MDLRLSRHSYHPFCTMGFLSAGSVRFATIEQPWRDNQPFKSCIPEGRFELIPYSSQRFDNVFEVAEVPGRTHILIHVGNTVDDVTGCIAIGMRHSQHTLAVRNSLDAMLVLRKMLAESKRHTLVIQYKRGSGGPMQCVD